MSVKAIQVGRLALIGDVHLEEGDETLDAFCEMLRSTAQRCDRLVLMGDLFNLWVGQQAMQLAHHRRVADQLRAIRSDGVGVDYVEGNRDYRIGALFEGDLFDEVWEGGGCYRIGERSVWAIHGDLTNPHDRQYRLWRRLSRSAIFWALFKLIPKRSRQRFADSLERRMRSTNREFKREFPTELVRRYGESFLAQGHTDVVLGHFHVERALRSEKSDGSIWVLPEWKGSRRHFEVGQDELGFLDSAPRL